MRLRLSMMRRRMCCRGPVITLMSSFGAVTSYLGDMYTESGQTLQGSFSAVSKPNFASKYSLESSRRYLHNALLCTAFGIHLRKLGKKGPAPLWNPLAKIGEKRAWPKQPRKGRKRENERPISSAQQATAL